MKAALNHAPLEIKNLIMEKPVRDYFRFGNGGILESQKRIRLPIVVKNQVVLLWPASCHSLRFTRVPAGERLPRELGGYFELLFKETPVEVPH